MDLILFPLLLVGMWFILVRPQQKRARAQREMVASIAVGDEIITAGGIVGTVRVLTEDRLHVEVAPGVELRMLRGAVSRKLSGGEGGEPGTTP